MNSLEPGPDDLKPGRWVRLSRTVQRLVAPNASLMTGPGTNSYVIGDVAIVDPGPDDGTHIGLLRAAVPRLQFVFVTHTHRDHSCGARILAQGTGARIVGLPAPADGLQDLSCVPSIEAAHDRVFELGDLQSGSSGEAGERSGEGHARGAGTADGRDDSRAHAALDTHAIQAPGPLRLRAIHTPGHASNHVCFLLEPEGLLFSGDHVLEGVTPVILPPDGDMAAYLDALERLKGYRPRAIAPGHGRLIEDPIRVIDGVIAHRGRREQRVLAALSERGRGTLDELLPSVYADVKPELLPIARYSLEAHLIKLGREGRARHEDGVWTGAAGLLGTHSSGPEARAFGADHDSPRGVNAERTLDGALAGDIGWKSGE